MNVLGAISSSVNSTSYIYFMILFRANSKVLLIQRLRLVYFTLSTYFILCALDYPIRRWVIRLPHILFGSDPLHILFLIWLWGVCRAHPYLGVVSDPVNVRLSTRLQMNSCALPIRQVPCGATFFCHCLFRRPETFRLHIVASKTIVLVLLLNFIVFLAKALTQGDSLCLFKLWGFLVLNDVEIMMARCIWWWRLIDNGRFGESLLLQGTFWVSEFLHLEVVDLLWVNHHVVVPKVRVIFTGFEILKL